MPIISDIIKKHHTSAKRNNYELVVRQIIRDIINEMVKDVVTNTKKNIKI